LDSLLKNAMRGNEEEKSKKRYKTGDWSWILAMGTAIGLFAALMSAGWASQLAADFSGMLLFVVIAYIVIYVRNAKVGEIGNVILTLLAGVFFYFGDKIVYPVAFAPINNLALIPPFQLSPSVQPGFTSPGPNTLTAILAFISAFSIVLLGAAAAARPGKRTLWASILAVGVMTLSVMTIIGAYLASKGAILPVSSEIFPPLTPLAGEYWILAVVYLFIGLGLWYSWGPAWWIYLGAEVLGIFVSLFTLNVFAIIFNLIIIAYLFMAHKAFGINKIPGL